VENHVYLSCGVQVTAVVWRAAIRIVVGVTDLVQRTGDGQAYVGYSVAGRLRDRVTLRMLYTVHKETRSADFLIWPQNQGRRFLLVWSQNRWFWVFQFVPQNRWLRFSDLELKITMTVS
jgi:hypothetical protein